MCEIGGNKLSMSFHVHLPCLVNCNKIQFIPLKVITMVFLEVVSFMDRVSSPKKTPVLMKKNFGKDYLQFAKVKNV